MDFLDSLKNNIDRVLQEVNKKCYAISYDLFTTVVYNSPTAPFANYSKGLLINNWFPAVGSYSLMTTTTTSYQGMGSLSRISEATKGTAFYGTDNFISLSNSLDYAYRAEYLGWPAPKWSGTVAPYAPIRNSLIAIAAKYKG